MSKHVLKNVLNDVVLLQSSINDEVIFNIVICELGILGAVMLFLF